MSLQFGECKKKPETGNAERRGRGRATTVKNALHPRFALASGREKFSLRKL